jgi:hypothetical protein
MRKWLIIFLLLVLALAALAVWLAGSVDAARPEPGEVRMEIENVF